MSWARCRFCGGESMWDFDFTPWLWELGSSLNLHLSVVWHKSLGSSGPWLSNWKMRSQKMFVMIKSSSCYEMICVKIPPRGEKYCSEGHCSNWTSRCFLWHQWVSDDNLREGGERLILFIWVFISHMRTGGRGLKWLLRGSPGKQRDRETGIPNSHIFSSSHFNHLSILNQAGNPSLLSGPTGSVWIFMIWGQ